MASRWDRFFMNKAALAGGMSKDPSTHVGCVVVRHKRELSSGWNGLPRFVADSPARMQRPAKYMWTVHAEANAIANAANLGVSLDQSTFYVTHFPCANCAGLMIQAGVSKVVVADGTTSMPEEQYAVARRMFYEAGVSVQDYK